MVYSKALFAPGLFPARESPYTNPSCLVPAAHALIGRKVSQRHISNPQFLAAKSGLDAGQCFTHKRRDVVCRYCTHIPPEAMKRLESILIAGCHNMFTESYIC